MEKLKNVIEKYEDVLSLFKIGTQLYFVPKEMGKLEIYEGIVVENIIEYDDFDVDTDGFRIKFEIKLEENNKQNFIIVIYKKRKDVFIDDYSDNNTTEKIKFFISNEIPIVYDYFLSKELAKDFLLIRNEAYMEKISLEVDEFKNKS